MAPFESTDQHLSRARSRKMMFGVLAIFFGVMWLFRNLGVLDGEWVEYIFSWKVMLIVIGLVGIAGNRGNTTGYMVILFIGSFFLLDEIFHIRHQFGNVFWPALLIGVGITSLLNVRKIESKYHDKKKTSSTDMLDCVSILSGGEIRITSKTFQGGRVTSILGGSEIDLSQADVEDGEYEIQVMNLLGGSSIIVPPHWDVKLDVTGILGGFSDSRKFFSSPVDHAKKITIRGTAILGGGEVKSF